MQILRIDLSRQEDSSVDLLVIELKEVEVILHEDEIGRWNLAVLKLL